MKKRQLKQSGVVFNEVEHTYTLNGKQLSGVTSVIRRHVFPDKYQDVPKHILDKRAAFGTQFHKDMELYINTGIESSTDTFNVFREHYKDGIKFIASEYIVTDGEHYASPIDAVDSDFNLYDFKTNSQKDIEYWRWQLSVYRHLFKMQNGFEPNGLKVLWINKDGVHDLIDITPVADGEVERLLECDINGEEFESTKQKFSEVVSKQRIEAVARIENEICRREAELKTIKADYDTMKGEILSAMIRNGICKWETDRMSLTVRAPYERKSVDNQKLKEYHLV